ncbi:MAG: phytanoyl-CoA dioxygenase family protein [Bacteroidota bacterium]
MMRLLKSPELDQCISKDGVVLVDFLNQDQLEELRAFYQNLHPDGSWPNLYDNIHMTIWCNDKSYKFKVKEKLESVFAASYERLFENYRALNHVFIVKKPGRETTFNIHQDWSVVEEEKYPSFNVWVPLEDVDETTGAMWIIKKSHRLKANIRGAGQLFPNYMDAMDHLRPYMTNFPMKAGQALLFYHATIHGSPPNTGRMPRVVAAASVLPQDVPFHIHFQKPGSEIIEVYSPEDEFMYNYDRLREESVFRPPGGKKVSEFSAANYQPLSVDEIIEVISA